MLIAGIAVICVLLLVLAFVAPRLSRHPQRGVEGALGAGQRTGGLLPGFLLGSMLTGGWDGDGSGDGFDGGDGGDAGDGGDGGDGGGDYGDGGGGGDAGGDFGGDGGGFDFGGGDFGGFDF